MKKLGLQKGQKGQGLIRADSQIQMGGNLKEMGDRAAEFKSLTHRAGKCCLGMVIGDLHESYFKGLGFESGKKRILL